MYMYLYTSKNRPLLYMHIYQHRVYVHMYMHLYISKNRSLLYIYISKNRPLLYMHTSKNRPLLPQKKKAQITDAAAPIFGNRWLTKTRQTD